MVQLDVADSEFVKKMTSYGDFPQHEPVEMTSSGRTLGYVVSKDDFEEVKRIKALSGRSRAVADFSEEEIQEILATSMSTEHDHLNALLEQE